MSDGLCEGCKALRREGNELRATIKLLRRREQETDQALERYQRRVEVAAAENATLRDQLARARREREQAVTESGPMAPSWWARVLGTRR